MSTARLKMIILIVTIPVVLVILPVFLSCSNEQDDEPEQIPIQIPVVEPSLDFCKIPPEEPPEKPATDEPKETDDVDEEHIEAEREVQQEPDEPRPPPEEAVYSINESFNEIAEQLDAIAAQYNCAAVSLVVYDGNERDYFTYQYGFADISARRPVNADTKFRVASLSKFVAALCAMSLDEEGLLDLDADISDYLGYPIRNPRFPDIAITTRMLMQHTSSIYDSSTYRSATGRNSTATTRRLLDSGACYAQWQPGTQFDYSNFGFAIFGLVCEMASGKRFDTLAREVLFEPLGIDAAFLPRTLNDRTNLAIVYNASHSLTRSVQRQIDSGVSSAQGSDHNLVQGNLTISMIDYSRILTMIGSGGILDYVRILSEESTKDIHNANVIGEAYLHGLSTRYQNDHSKPFAGSYWHTGSAWGIFAQYHYYIDNSQNRGVAVITTGARTGRLENGMVEVCTDLSTAAWQILE